MGLEFLKWLRDQPALAALPVIVFSSSANKNDINEAFRLGARAYLVKPLAMDERIRLMKTLKEFWLELNQFPVEG